MSEWCRAAYAYRNRDDEAVVDAIIPEGLNDADTFTRLRGFLFLGAAACGAEIRKTDPGPDGFWGFELIDARTDRPVDPGTAGDPGVVARMVTAAANQDYATVLALAENHLPVTAGPERADVVYDLLRLYVSFWPAALGGEPR